MASYDLDTNEMALILLLPQAERKVTKGANSQQSDAVQQASSRPVADNRPEQHILPHVVPSATPAAADVTTAFSGFSGVQHTYSNELATMDDVAALQAIESPAVWGALSTTPAEQVRWG